jgi:6-pyruvoyltetrahydropterin/6-carboxytetrahydropterin synthase
VSQELRFCYGHRLLGHPGKCARLHGHNARVFVLVRAERVDANGMVIDFDAMHQRARRYLDEALDHRMLLQKGCPSRKYGWSSNRAASPLMRCPDQRGR